MSLLDQFPNRIETFIKSANQNGLRMILVGGGAVNFHGYQRHSADLDFWIEIGQKNMGRLLIVLREMGYKIEKLPAAVEKGQQNISIKISPVFDLELITNFNPGKTFEDAYSESELVDKDELKYHVLNFRDLIQSKISSPRVKDKLDVEELQKIRLKKK